jgi:glycosyltransferase involved in cell wall biosynthesis
MKKRVCFFARVPDKKYFDLCEFYANDINIFEKLGYEVILVNRVRDLPFSADIYYSWFFGWSIFPLLISLLSGKKHIVCGNIHTNNGGGLNDWPFIKKTIMKFVLRKSDASIFTSKTELLRLGQFQPLNPILIYNAYDAKVYRPSFSKNPEKYILTITHLTKGNIQRKRLFDCIKAFNKLIQKGVNVKYKIAGNIGDGYNDIFDYLNELDLLKYVDILGGISREEKVALLQNASVYLQPTYCEGFGLALVEAEACGTPVVTSEEECVREINGDSVLYGNTVEELAYCLQDLLCHAEKWSNYSDSGVRNSQKYELAHRKKKLETLL